MRLSEHESDYLGMGQHPKVIEATCAAVPRGAERLRITPTPAHDPRLIGQLTQALVSVWRKLHLELGINHQLLRSAHERSSQVDKEEV
jgi:hypothetical protein